MIYFSLSNKSFHFQAQGELDRCRSEQYNQLHNRLHFCDVLEFLRSSCLASKGRVYRVKFITFSFGLLK